MNHRVTSADIKKNINSGAYSELRFASAAIKRTLLSEPDKKQLLRDAELYFKHLAEKKNNHTKPAVSRKKRVVTVRPTTYQDLVRELSSLDKRRDEILKMIEAAKLRDLIESDPERLKRALQLLEKQEHEVQDNQSFAEH